MTLSNPETLGSHTVLQAVEGAIALATAMAEDAEGREHGITGILAGFLRWPSELSEAVGPGHRAQQRVAGAVGIAAQVFVGVLATALGAGVVAAVVALWRAVVG